MEFDRRTRYASTGAAATQDAPVPGKQTLTQGMVQMHPAAAPNSERAEPATTPPLPAPSGPRPSLQMLFGRRDASDPERVHAAAARGTATAATQLPHLEQIQHSFGRHDVSGVQAHVGAEAAASAQEMGAAAYATGNHVVLGAGTDLHTVAHEAAHVVQQRGGVRLKGGVGEVGDAYERQADEVADAVVRGEGAEPLLNQSTGAPASAAVQRKDEPGAAPASPGGRKRTAREQEDGLPPAEAPVQLEIDPNGPPNSRIIITSPRRGLEDDLNRTGVVRRTSRYANYLAVEFHDERGPLYRVHYTEADYLRDDVPSRRGSFDDSSSDDERMHEVVNKLKTSTPKPSVPELPNPQRDVLAGMFETIVLAHPSLDFLRGDLARLKMLNTKDWAELGITISTEEISKLFTETGVIKIHRSDDDSITTLLIGCGNRPLPDEVFGEEDKHDHSDCYTIDPNIQMRPTVVGLFGRQSLAAAFRPGQFKVIRYEGVFALTGPNDVAANPYLFEDIRVLLTEDGCAVLPIRLPDMDMDLVVVKSGGALVCKTEPYVNLLIEQFVKAYTDESRRS